ncbi:hypothetical protein BD779DRAFT_1529301 [Infundibulicybe gibba]|nr:hypothetical protein BD779DRAFT_1529301 [Infundibulicybe gibba]
MRPPSLQYALVWLCYGKILLALGRRERSTPRQVARWLGLSIIRHRNISYTITIFSHNLLILLILRLLVFDTLPLTSSKLTGRSKILKNDSWRPHLPTMPCSLGGYTHARIVMIQLSDV